MQRFFKILSAILFVFSLFVFTMLFVGDKIIPDNVTAIENLQYQAPMIMGIELYKVEAEKEVSATVNNVKRNDNTATIKLFNIIPVKNTVITNTQRRYVVPGGELFGIKLYSDGVIIVDTDYVETETGKVNPSQESGLKVGDIIRRIDNINIESTKHLSQILQKSKGKAITITVIRENKTIKVNFNTVKEKATGQYKAGLWVRDSTAGLGTVTFYNPLNGTFGGLGHPVYDVDTGEIIPVKSGEMAEAVVNGLYKSSNGSVGELCGLLTGKNNGIICLNHITGLYGFTECKNDVFIPVALRQETKEGKAQIISTVDDKKEYYEIEIAKINSNSSSVNKDMIIRITDERLLNKTGGIVQGMSGSPIIQNGMLVGAVTHVFVNNPKIGYAIFAQRMIETSELVAEEYAEKAS